MTTTAYPTATPESIWAILQETSELQKENQKAIRELQKSQKITDNQINNLQKTLGVTDQQMQESREEFSKSLKESREAFDRRMEKINETMGSWGNNLGEFAEEYFFNSFENGQRNFFGEKFDEIEKNIKGIKKDYKDEYDILLINGKSIGIIEVKFKAHIKDMPKIIRKADTFRVNFPEYKNHKVFLGLATMSFFPELEQECINEGIAIIKQVGDNVVINDKHLKIF